MATKETKKDIEKYDEIYPLAELINAVNRMLSEPIPIKIAMVSSQGDVIFTTRLVEDLGITASAFIKPFYRSILWANLLGELLVQQNMETFGKLVMVPRYSIFVNEYAHKNTGMRLEKNNILIFQFHISLVYRLINETLSTELASETSKINVITGGKKVKREEENNSVTTYADDKSYRLIVAKHSEVRRCFQNAISTIMEFHGLKNKEVFVQDNMFNYEIIIKDK